MSLKLIKPAPLCVLAFATYVSGIQFTNDSCIEVGSHFAPKALTNMVRHSHEYVTYNNTCCKSSSYIIIESNNEYVAYIEGNGRAFNCSNNTKNQFIVLARNLGYANITAYTLSKDNSTRANLNSLNVTVLQGRSVLNRLFIVVVFINLILLSFGFGCRLRLDNLKDILKRPVAPAIGLSCQIILMPLVNKCFLFILCSLNSLLTYR